MTTEVSFYRLLKKSIGLIIIEIMKTIRKYLKISGRVQGVGYRYFTLQNAKSLNIHGWVQNMPDGTVEVLLIGNSGDLQQMIQKLWKGPFSARVEDIKELDVDQNTAQVHSFRVRS